MDVLDKLDLKQCWASLLDCYGNTNISTSPCTWYPTGEMSVINQLKCVSFTNPFVSTFVYPEKTSGYFLYGLTILNIFQDGIH